MHYYLTQEGEALDEICFRHYGGLSGGVVEEVLECNPNLAIHASHLPPGLRIGLPTFEKTTVKKITRLWD